MNLKQDIACKYHIYSFRTYFLRLRQRRQDPPTLLSSPRVIVPHILLLDDVNEDCINNRHSQYRPHHHQ